MTSPRLGKRLLVAVEDEPFPRGPSGESCRLKLNDWLDLAKQSEPEVQIEVCPVSELEDRRPDVIEAFATRHGMLTNKTFPTLREHELVNHFSSYWPAVVRSGVPAIGVLGGTPRQFPVFVRGEQGTFAGGGLIRSAGALKRLVESGRPLVVRPWVEILAADRRPSVRLELRAHSVAGRTVAVEYLFPPWAAQRPTGKELRAGLDWAATQQAAATQHTDRIAAEVNCRWLVADFAGTSEGLRLIELNPGWCAGIAHKEAARAVHLAVIEAVSSQA